MDQNNHTEPVPVDISKIKSKVVFNMTQRQIFFFVLAGFFGVPVFFATKSLLGPDISVLLMVVVMSPFFALAIYEKDGYTADQIFYFWFRKEYLMPGIRPFQTEFPISARSTEKTYEKPDHNMKKKQWKKQGLSIRKGGASFARQKSKKKKKYS